ncbi:hypothetical protein DSO57_1029747 [Entomophthora muscae]|uniref:Uncharacterized protein n=1 Tax=Entomophthora muscae TaxID=34485 RepID=A0ACC2TCF3_9FUNG|nr:hypothetical protein DSO57_1029747 [Entomophthora muscae]
MEPPVTLKLMPASTPNLHQDYTNELFVIAYITLTEVIDTIILATSPWSWPQSCGRPCLQDPQPVCSQKTTGQLPKVVSLTQIATTENQIIPW